MKRTAIALTLATLAAAAMAQAPKTAGESSEIVALRAECAASYGNKLEGKPHSANEYQFVYYKGEYKGEYKPGHYLACTEGQYASYLDKADPARVMSAYPTAAGRPTAKGKDYYKDGKSKDSKDYYYKGEKK